MLYPFLHLLLLVDHYPFEEVVHLEHLVGGIIQ
jgi:hypothetical protein